MTDLGVEAPIGPVLGGPRRSRERVRIVAVGVVAALVLAAGIGLVGNGATSEGTPPPSRGATESPVASPTDDPTDVPPTENVGLGCAPVRRGSAPELRLAPDGAPGVRTAGLPRPAGAIPSPSDAAWPLPDVDHAVRSGEFDALLLVPDGEACVRYVVAEYRPADASVGGPWPIAFRTLNVSPPRPTVALGRMPPGDWSVRIVAYFSTGIAGQEDANVVERFFRVFAGRAESPIPTPEVSPTVPCAPLPAEAAVPRLALYGASDGPTLGVVPGTGRPSVGIAQAGAAIEIRSVEDVCALNWFIQAVNIDTNETIEIATQENPINDPFRFAQNRWLLPSLPTGLLEITATMGYSADVSITRRWSLIVEVPEFPEVNLLTPDGSGAPTLVGCGVTWTYPLATSVVESCVDQRIPEGLETLTVTVPAGLPVRIEAPGWTIVGWNSACGQLVGAIGTPAELNIVDGCDLGGSRVPGPIAFLPRPGAPIVVVYVNLEKDGVLVGGPVYLSVAVAP